MSLPGIDSRTYAILAGQLGGLAEQAGRYDDSEKWLSRGIGALDEDSEELANLLVNRSLVNMRRLRLSSASGDAARASQIFDALGLSVDLAQNLHNEGYMALLGGDLITAMRVMSAARVTLVDVSPVFAAVCDVDRAEVLRDAGHTIEAERILAEAAAVFGRQRMPQSRAEAEYHLARSLLAHDPPARWPRARRDGSARWGAIRGRREPRRCACAPSWRAARSCGPDITSPRPDGCPVETRLTRRRTISNDSASATTRRLCA
jgi:hypothetical protein